MSQHEPAAPSPAPSTALHPESVVVSAGRPAVVPGGALNQPIVQASTFHAGGERGYARQGNDTIAAFEDAVGALEGGRAIAFSSGVAATAAVLDGLPVGSTVIVPTTFYNLHRTIFDEHAALGRIRTTTVDITDTDAVVRAMEAVATTVNTAFPAPVAVLWLEIPTNPMLTVADLPALTAAARSRNVLSVVDSTVATPLGIRPLEHGADVVMHSGTKWIAGHSDVLSGLLVTADAGLADRLFRARLKTGAVPGALDAFLALRGLRTLSVRLERSVATAAVLAARLREHPNVRSVNYLGFADHPNADRVAALLDHRGALISFTVDSVERADALCARTQLIAHATSIGGVESLIERRGQYPGELEQGSPAELARLSVGIEHVEDLWDDLRRALD